jgi:hypothetical protein
MAYLLDANVFIQAKNLHYGFDFCPAFWDWVIAENAASRVFSVERVEGELAAIADDLSVWAATRNPQFFLKVEPAMLPNLTAVSAWAAGQQYEPAAVNTFLQSGDYYLVGQALALGYTVVTHEVPSNSTKKIKIPDICVGMRVPCVTPFEMLRRSRARFVMAPGAGATPGGPGGP